MNSSETRDNSGADTPPSAGWSVGIPSLLRGLGAAAVLFSLYSFLVRGWSGSSDLMRYLVLLGHTGLLAAIALMSARYLNESKSPRLLLGLGLVSVSACFAVLGAFVYAAVVAIGEPQVPSFLLWSGVSLEAAIGLVVTSLIVLIPVVSLGFRTLTRPVAGTLGPLFLLGNAILLVPVREASLVAAIAAVLGLMLLWVSVSLRRRRLETHTPEGIAALALQFLPLAILLGRSCLLYEADAAVVVVGAVLVFFVLRQVAQVLHGQYWARVVLELSSLCPALVASYSGAALLEQIGCSASAALFSAALLGYLLIVELSTRAVRFVSGYRLLGTALLAAGVLISVVIARSTLVGLSAVLLGVALLVCSSHWRSRSMLVAAVFSAGVGLISVVQTLLTWFDFGNWIVLALVGIAAIVLASLLESRGQQFQCRLRHYRREYATWTL